MSRRTDFWLSIAALVCFAVFLVGLNACDGPTDTDALIADALNLQDAQAAAVLAAGTRK